MTNGMVTNPTTVPQSYRSPSISPKTTPEQAGGQQGDAEQIEPVPDARAGRPA